MFLIDAEKLIKKLIHHAFYHKSEKKNYKNYLIYKSSKKMF